MKSIFNIYEEYIFEAFASNIIRMIKQDIETTTDYNFTRFINRYQSLSNVLWDKVEDSDIETMPGTDQSMYYFRALKAGKDDFKLGNGKRMPIKDKNVIIFFYRDDRLIAFYIKDFDAFFARYRGDQGEFELINKPREAENYTKTADVWYVVSISNNDATKLKNTRLSSRVDMIPDLTADDRALKHNVKGVLGKEKGGYYYYEAGRYYRYCDDLIKKTKDRYKEIVAKNKASKSNTDEIDNSVKEVLNKLAETTIKFNKHRGDLDYSYKYKLERLMKLMYGEAQAYGSGRNISSYITGGLMKEYEDYCKTWWDLGKGGFSFNTSMYLRDFEKYEKSIKQIINKMNVIFREFEEI